MGRTRYVWRLLVSVGNGEGSNVFLNHPPIMRSFATTFLLLLVALPVAAQPATYADSAGVSRISYTRLDQLTKTQSAFFSGERSEVSFYFIELRNLDTGEALRGVEVAISSTEQKVVGGSIGMAAIGSLWGGSADVTYRRIENSGHILLDGEEIRTVVEFLNSVLGELGREQDQFKVYRIALQDRFELGMMYDPDYRPDNYGENSRRRPHPREYWQFTVTADGVTYTLDYEDGVEVLQALNRWKDEVEPGGTEAAGG